MQNDLNKLLEEYCEIINSKKNINNRKFWEKCCQPWYGEHWRGIPKKDLKKAPIIINPEKALWAKIFNFNLKDYYNSPEEWLKQELKTRIYKFTNWRSNNYFDNNFYIWFASPTEISFFGAKVGFFKDRSPCIIGSKPILEDKKNLKKLKIPDFLKSGLMPKIHFFYKEIKDILDKSNTGLNVIFPDWSRGPFGIAVLLRGMENILIDMIDDPKYIHDLMRFIVESQKEWLRNRKEFLGSSNHPLGIIADDDVGSPMISPRMYEEYILPYEIELSEFKGGFSYWHSCNDTRDFFKYIIKIPNLAMINVSPWSDDKKASEIIKDQTAIDRTLHPVDDVLESNEDKVYRKINKILGIFDNNVKYIINLNGIDSINRLESDLKKIKRFLEIYNGMTE